MSDEKIPEKITPEEYASLYDAIKIPGHENTLNLTGLDLAAKPKKYWDVGVAPDIENWCRTNMDAAAALVVEDCSIVVDEANDDEIVFVIWCPEMVRDIGHKAKLTDLLVDIDTLDLMDLRDHLDRMIACRPPVESGDDE
jgi:hypothetical protein